MTKAKKKTLTSAPIVRFRKAKPIKIVTKKALRAIADRIYNPRTRRYLRLCSGDLQNGPDPGTPKRTMHCGLGELYFAVTGRHPMDDGKNERAVSRLVAERSTLKSGDRRVEFIDMLDAIPGRNDGSLTYLQRARVVAQTLREAAEILPK